jgi:predicted RNA-binding Zn ribbon-like protein
VGTYQVKAKSPFEYTGGDLCLDFANTVDNRTSDHAEELLTNYDRLLRWGEETGAISGKTVEHLRRMAAEEPGSARSVLRHAVALRDSIYEIFSAVAQRRGIPNASLATLNRAAQRASEHAQIAPTNRRFDWEWTSPESNLDSMLWPVARAAAELLTSEDISKVRQCASETCSWLFLDTTKNHCRRWCDMKICGNRDKAKRYYQRQKAETS